MIEGEESGKGMRDFPSSSPGIYMVMRDIYYGLSRDGEAHGDVCLREIYYTLLVG